MSEAATSRENRTEVKRRHTKMSTRAVERLQRMADALAAPEPMAVMIFRDPSRKKSKAEKVAELMAQLRFERRQIANNARKRRSEESIAALSRP